MQVQVTQEYIDGFVKANETFLYQLVFDPKSRKMRPIHDYPSGLNANVLPYCGSLLSDQVALDLALGNIDLHSLKVVNFYDPDVGTATDKPKYGKRCNHPSIWKRDFNPGQPLPLTMKEEESKKRQDQVRQVLQCFSNPPQDNQNQRKRKRKSSPPLVCTPEKTNGNKSYNFSERNNDDEEDEETVLIYKSRFFKPKAKLSKPPQKSNVAGDWLDQLEDSAPKNPVTKCVQDQESELKENGTNSVQVLKKAFKPLKTEEALVEKRPLNPFAIKTPEKRTIVEPLEVAAEEVSVNAKLQEPTISPAHPAAVKERESDVDTSASSEKSVYFQPKNIISRRPKGISGLLKKSSVKKCQNGRQPSLFDMWSKK